MPRTSISRPRSRMNYSLDPTQSPEHPVGFATVVDVYDIASDIGKECEKIIDRYGADTVTALMPKLINALELLENLASKNEWENALLGELKAKIEQLENDKLEKAEYRQKFDKELEAIEDQWRTESKDLISLVSLLQAENRRLVKDYGTTGGAGRPGSGDSTPLSPTEGASDGTMLEKLRVALERQRIELREKDRILQDKSDDLDTLRSQVDRFTSSSRELRRKHKCLQTQVRTLCDERADFLVQLQDQHRDISGLRQRLGLAQKENEDLTKCDIAYPSNKAVFDLDDPNRPRFTTAELKDILHERNELKARVSDLEDELDSYRPKKPETDNSSKLEFILGKFEEACNSILPDLSLELEPVKDVPADEDRPVEGPLPYEPDDAPWKKSSESLFAPHAGAPILHGAVNTRMVVIARIHLPVGRPKPNISDGMWAWGTSLWRSSATVPSHRCAAAGCSSAAAAAAASTSTWALAKEWIGGIRDTVLLLCRREETRAVLPTACAAIRTDLFKF